MFATRSVNRVWSFSGASGVNVTVVSPLLVCSAPLIVLMPLLSVTFAGVTLPGSIAFENVTSTTVASGTPTADGTGDTLITAGAVTSKVVSGAAVGPMIVPLRNAIPGP